MSTNQHCNRFTIVESSGGDADLPKELFPILSDLTLEELDKRIGVMEKEFLHIHGLAAFAQSQLRADTLSKKTSEQILGAIAESAFWGMKWLEDRFLVEGSFPCESCDGPVSNRSETDVSSSGKGGRNE